MRLGNYAIIGSLSAILAGAVPLVPTLATGQEQGIEELTRGPVHEAFAASVSFNPEAGILVDKAPPDLIEEVPPEQRPEGDNVSWISGYWGWDEEQSDFIWISGIWRNLPPGRQWVPGYWGEAQGKWQWTSGYWADEEEQEVEYLPEPPKSIESGPNVNAPSKNHVWVSGNWTYRETRYAWTPGYWEPAQPSWVWIPAHYRWTPCGYVFVGGYWDYDINRRGMIFAPVRIRHDVYSTPGYAYTPLMVISLNAFVSHMFVRPTYCHYYFGDYYSPRYRDHGYYAPHLYNAGHRGYDPFYVHNRWKHRDDGDWERRRIDDFNYYRDHEDARPPRTWKDMQARPDAGRRDRRGDDGEIAQPLDRYVKNHRDSQRFQTVNKESRDKIVEQRQQMRKFGQERQHLEKTTLKPAIDAGGKPEAVKREKFAKSPLVSKQPRDLTGDDAPPKRHGTRDNDSRKTSDRNIDPGKDPVIPNNADKLKKPDGFRKRDPDKTLKPDVDPGKDPVIPNNPDKLKKPDGFRKRDSDTTLNPDIDPGKAPVIPNNTDKLKKPDGFRKRESDKTLKPDIDPKRVKEDANPPPKRIVTPETERRKLPETRREPDASRTKKMEPERNREPASEPKKQVIPETPKPKITPQPERQRQIVPEQRKSPSRQPESAPSNKKSQREEETTGDFRKKR